MKTLRWEDVTVAEMQAGSMLGYECIVDGDTKHVFVYDRCDTESLLKELVDSVW